MRSQIIYVFYFQEIQIRKVNMRSQIVNVPNDNFECSKLEDNKFSQFFYPTKNWFSPKAHNKRLCSSSKSARSSLIYLSRPPTPGEVFLSKHGEGFVLAATDTPAWAANINYNASNHLEATMIRACEHASYCPQLAARRTSSWSKYSAVLHDVHAFPCSIEYWLLLPQFCYEMWKVNFYLWQRPKKNTTNL